MTKTQESRIEKNTGRALSGRRSSDVPRTTATPASARRPDRRRRTRCRQGRWHLGNSRRAARPEGGPSPRAGGSPADCSGADWRPTGRRPRDWRSRDRPPPGPHRTDRRVRGRRRWDSYPSGWRAQASCPGDQCRPTPRHSEMPADRLARRSRATPDAAPGSTGETHQPRSARTSPTTRYRRPPGAGMVLPRLSFFRHLTGHREPRQARRS
jgi:hypothetical protein